MYENCDRCNKLHDDGTILVRGKETRYICFDCSDKLHEVKEEDELAYEKEVEKIFKKNTL